MEAIGIMPFDMEVKRGEAVYLRDPETPAKLRCRITVNERAEVAYA